MSLAPCAVNSPGFTPQLDHGSAEYMLIWSGDEMGGRTPWRVRMTTNCNRAPSVLVATGTDLVVTCARDAWTHKKIRAVSSRESDRSASFSMKRVPPSNLVWFKLELESQHELQPSRRADAGGTGIEHVRDSPKSRDRRDIGRRIRINRM